MKPSEPSAPTAPSVASNAGSVGADVGSSAGSLVARGLTKAYGGRSVLEDVGLEARPDEIVALLGPNGAGKTTAFRIIAGLVRPSAGTVDLGGRDVTALPLHRRARLGLGYLPQAPSVFRRLTVRANLEAVLALQPGLTRPQVERRIEAGLAEVDLTDRAELMADRLSGGERRRLELARCLATRPRWLLLDEPFYGIDPIGVRDLQQRLRALRGRGLTVLMTDHNALATLPLCDRAYLLVGGRIVESGTRSELAQSATARAAYFGPDVRLDAG